jgi:hypothetical protein
MTKANPPAPRWKKPELVKLGKMADVAGLVVSTVQGIRLNRT